MSVLWSNARTWATQQWLPCAMPERSRVRRLHEALLRLLLVLRRRRLTLRLFEAISVRWSLHGLNSHESRRRLLLLRATWRCVTCRRGQQGC